MQVEAQRQAKEASEAIHHEKFKLEILKQKSRHDQSAVASPEVKRHLAEFVLKKKRQEAQDRRKEENEAKKKDKDEKKKEQVCQSKTIL